MSLLQGVKARDPEAWRRLLYLYGPLVCHWCGNARVPPQDADDIAQEVFLTVATKITDFRRERPGDSFRGWLWTIARHKIGDWIRKRRAQTREFHGPDAWTYLSAAADTDADDGDVAADTPEVGGLYRRALDLIRSEFEEPSWQAFWRTAAEGQDAASVATALQLSRNAVYVAKSRILRRLREVLGESE
jgi:RNA polymerase sigma-70 factor (ECF subfamily)